MSRWCTSRSGVVIGTGEDATCMGESCDWLGELEPGAEARLVRGQ